MRVSKTTVLEWLGPNGTFDHRGSSVWNLYFAAKNWLGISDQEIARTGAKLLQPPEPDQGFLPFGWESPR